MNLDFLGDALDHWKGGIFRWLKDWGILYDLKCDLMATDQHLWKEFDYSLYAKIVGIDNNQIIRHNLSITNQENRRKYFEEINHKGDIFFDPDIGLDARKTTVPQSDLPKYLTCQELIDQLLGHRNSLVMVYQHIRSRITSERVDEIICILTERFPETRFSCLTYESSSVVMLIFSLNNDRIRNAMGKFESVLGTNVKNRIRIKTSEKPSEI